MNNLREGLLEKSKLAQHAYEGHRVGCEEARILEIKSNSRCRKFKELADTQPIQLGNFFHM
jgi:hypothetical protein